MKLLDYMIEQRKGHYCHAIVVTYQYDIENVIESLISELREQFTLAEYIEFFNSMGLYYEEGEGTDQQKADIIEAENFDIEAYVIECYNGL